MIQFILLLGRVVGYDDSRTILASKKTWTESHSEQVRNTTQMYQMKYHTYILIMFTIFFLRFLVWGSMWFSANIRQKIRHQNFSQTFSPKNLLFAKKKHICRKFCSTTRTRKSQIFRPPKIFVFWYNKKIYGNTNDPPFMTPRKTASKQVATWHPKPDIPRILRGGKNLWQVPLWILRPVEA